MNINIIDLCVSIGIAVFVYGLILTLILWGIKDANTYKVKPKETKSNNGQEDFDEQRQVITMFGFTRNKKTFAIGEVKEFDVAIHIDKQKPKWAIIATKDDETIEEYGAMLPTEIVYNTKRNGFILTKKIVEIYDWDVQLFVDTNRKLVEFARHKWIEEEIENLSHKNAIEKLESQLAEYAQKENEQ